MKDFIVVFGKDNARIIKGINPSDWQNVPGVAVNPDLSELKGIPPNHWKLVDSKIVSKPEEEKEISSPTIIEHKISLDRKLVDTHLSSHRLTTILYSIGFSITISIAFHFFWKPLV